MGRHVPVVRCSCYRGCCAFVVLFFFFVPPDHECIAATAQYMDVMMVCQCVRWTVRRKCSQVTDRVFRACTQL